MAQEAQQKIKTRYERLDPRKIRLLEVNAHYMKHEEYHRLVENIKADGEPTSTPLVWQVHDDDTQQPILDEDGEPIYEVLSGNHRTRASIDADMPTIMYQIIEGYIPKPKRLAIQLSHNSITGEDDPAILKTLYEDIDDVSMRLYSGLDDKTLKLLDEVQLVSLSEANLQFQTVSITFLPDELEHVEGVLDEVKKAAKGSKAHWVARWSEYDAYLDSLEAASESHGIKNIATALMLVLAIFRRHVTDLQEGFLDDEGEAIKPKQRIPTETVLGDVFMPAATAARLNKAINRALSQQKIGKSQRWQIIDLLLDAYEGKSDGG